MQQSLELRVIKVQTLTGDANLTTEKFCVTISHFWTTLLLYKLDEFESQDSGVRLENRTHHGEEVLT